MKKNTTSTFLFLCFLTFITPGRADEGMWLPFLLDQLNIKDMQAHGCKLTASDIYDVNHGSMKDGVALFGGGCTAEVISNDGLLLTNHHCGYGSAQALSTVENNFFEKGFWAMNRQQELPCKGLTVTFIVRMDDVTSQILPQLSDTLTEKQRDARIKKIAGFIEKNAVAGTHYTAQLKSFYNGNQFILIISEVFKDIRLVGFPPNTIGNFGGDTDNWIWPRHTGDFSLFRIYANKDNQSAEYSNENVPYHPKYSFTISLKGVKEGDFTMVYGFPGQTREYLPAEGLDLVMNYQDPTRISIREQRLNIWRKEMQSDKSIFIKYTSKEKGLSNAYKKWQGELKGLTANSAIEKKQAQENEFANWAADKPEYKNVVTDFKAAYAKYKEVSNANDFINEAALGVELLAFAANYNALIDSSFSPTLADTIFLKQKAKLRNTADGFYKNYDQAVDKKMAKALLPLYVKQFSTADQTRFIPNLLSNKLEKAIDVLYAKSVLLQADKFNAIIKEGSRKDIQQLVKDPAIALFREIKNIQDKEINPVLATSTERINRAQRTYVRGLMAMNKAKTFYPDANSTLRLTYGQVDGMSPADGIHYRYATTLDGLMAKEDTANEEFLVSPKLKSLYAKKDYGRYAVNGTVPIAFIASNHTTGGNSGSPVINAKGQLIGTNFDRIWEGTMSDLLYDVNRCRNISLDVRYTLFIIDKFAGAGYLINEMKVID